MTGEMEEKQMHATLAFRKQPGVVSSLRRW